MKRLSAKELLAENPQIATDDVETAQRMLDELRAGGLEKARYRLATPLTGHRSAGDSKHHSARHTHVARRH